MKKTENHYINFNLKTASAYPRGVILFLATLLSLSASAQHNTSWHLFDYDVKGYATKIVPTGSYNESIMAGTKYDANHQFGEPHFIRLDDGGGAKSPDAPGILAHNLFPDPNFIDQRVVDVIAKDVNEYYMVILAREDGNNLPNAQDKIKIIRVDDNANSILEEVYYDPGNGYNLYPMSAMYNVTKDNNGNVRQLLYICGFVSLDFTTAYPSQPYYTTEKQTFIMSIDIDENSPDYLKIQNVKYFETSPSGSIPGENDWDMGMRMQVLEKNTNTFIMGNDQPFSNAIFMTGAVNSMSGIYNTTRIVRSGTAIYLLDPWSLNTRVGNTHLANLRENEDGGGYQEYGVGVAESNNGEDMYVISNVYSKYGDSPTQPEDWYNYSGTIIVWPPPVPAINPPFNAKADRMIITHTNDWFATQWMTTSTTRKMLRVPSKGVYGVQILPSITLSQRGPNGTRFVVAGMAIDRSQSPSCSFMWPLSADSKVDATNIIPFLWDVDVDFINEVPGSLNILGDIAYAPFDFYYPPVGQSTITYYKNQGSTGDPNVGADLNSYAILGGGLSHIFYGPKFADRSLLSRDGSIVMNAPKFGPEQQKPDADGTVHTPGPSKLGLKTILIGDNGAGAYFLDQGCLTGCGLEVRDEQIQLHYDISYSRFIKDTNPPPNPTDPMAYTVNGDCSGLQRWGQVFKSTGIKNLPKGTAAMVYPNPASGSVNIQLDKGIAATATIKVQLVNMQGQLISTLFEGAASGLHSNHTLQLPNVAGGLYMVNIYVNGKQEHIQKLNIE